MKKTVKNISVGIFLMGYSLISNSATLIVNNGTLMGATGVDVNGTLYDVSFLDGTCVELYNGCDDNSDFPFTNPANLYDGSLIMTAMQALLDQVFVDSSVGLFDSQPALMNGCNTPGGCNIATPFSVNSTGGLGVFVAHNWALEYRDVISQGSGGYDTGDTSPIPGYEDIKVYAVWSEVSPVPVPAAIWLFGSGLLVLIGIARKKV